MGKFLRTPVVKFLASALSYTAFVTMIIAYSATEHPSSGYKISEHPILGPQFLKYLNDCTDAGKSPATQDVFVRYHVIGIGTIALSIWIAGTMNCDWEP